MKRENEINALLKRATEQLKDIRSEYEKSLHSQHVTDLLKVDIKNYCENLRSVLDYLAHTIRETHCSVVNLKDKFYFPIFLNNAAYISQMGRWYPSLEATCKSLYDFLESLQPYNQGWAWLGHVNIINNENKHGSLVEQTRNEQVQITAKSQSGAAVSWNPGNVKFGSGVSIIGMPIDPRTQMPVPTSPTQIVTKTVWVDFRFASINVSALHLLETALKGVERIVSETKKYL